MATCHLKCALSSSDGVQSRMFDVRFARRAMPKLIPFANPREGNSEYADNKCKMSGMVVWVVTPSSLVDCYQRFAETHCPLLQSSRVTTLVSATTQTTATELKCHLLWTEETTPVGRWLRLLRQSQHLTAAEHTDPARRSVTQFFRQCLHNPTDAYVTSFKAPDC
jgi:hypothetical protein